MYEIILLLYYEFILVRVGPARGGSRGCSSGARDSRGLGPGHSNYRSFILPNFYLNIKLTQRPLIILHGSTRVYSLYYLP
jgi:hypothetical protein